MIIGLDIGYGFTKAYSEDEGGKQLVSVFPSLVATHDPNKDTFYKPEQVKVNQQYFVVGDTVKECGYIEIPVVRNDFVYSAEYRALFAKAIAAVSENSKDDVHKVVLGLPPSFFSQEAIAEITGLINSSEIAVENGKDVKKIRADQIIFMPQGMGAYVAYLADSGKPAGTTVIIDIGFHTADFVLIVNGKYSFDKARSYPVGVKALYDRIKAGFSKKHGFFISDEAVWLLLKNREIEHFKQTYKYDCSQDIADYQKILVEYIKEFARLVSEITVSEVILAGGGASILSSYIKNIEIVNFPWIANARGYYLYGRKVFDRKTS